MLLNIDRDRNIDFLGKKMSIFCWTHIAVGHTIQGRPVILLYIGTLPQTNCNKRFYG